MKEIAPTYYPRFACIADRCRHSCCIGWEIDIDGDALTRYGATEGELGQRLKENIRRTETPHFVLTESQRCPFLNSHGLCDLIIGLGEESLCQICADHPRFRNAFSDRTEIGLGLCCEAAGRLILSETAPAELMVLTDDGEDEGLWEEEWALLTLRGEVFALLQDRHKSIPERISGMLELCGAVLPEWSMAEWAEQYLALERLDEEWTQRLTALRNAEPAKPPLPLKDTVWEQLLVYFVYRHFPAALEDEDIPSKAGFAAVSFALIHALAVVQYQETASFTLDDLVEIARMYSAEVEYSDENLEILFDILKNEQ